MSIFNNQHESSDSEDWNEDENQIPDGLADQWKEQEKLGRRAGVCSNCGWAFPEEQLSCAHCGESVELPSNALKDTVDFFFKTPWGWICVLIGALLLTSFLLRTSSNV